MAKFLTTTAFVLGALTATGASAATYSYSADSTLNGVENASFKYNEDTESFKMSFTTGATNPKDGNKPIDGFWVVINDGPQPYHEGAGHLAILYSDLSSVWAYQYTGKGVTGVNGSFATNPFLGKFEDVITATDAGGGKTTYELMMDVTDINDADLPTSTGKPWEGLKFDEKIGTWLHTTSSSFADCKGGPIDTDDKLNCFSGNKWLGWDEVKKDASVVPLPAGLPLLLAGLGTFGFARRFKKA
ncbi:MAG: VPLPA-CTERM sorting domain-containing protein [Pseudomonadota bacterium]